MDSSNNLNNPSLVSWVTTDLDTELSLRTSQNRPKSPIKINNQDCGFPRLSQIAAARTALAKNLGDLVPPRSLRNIPSICRPMSECNSLIVTAKNYNSGKTTQSEMIFNDENLFRKILVDENLSDCKAVVIRKSHRRTAVTDVLIGNLKKLLSRRSDLKLIFKETLEADKLSSYFSDFKVLTIPRNYLPVQILYTNQPVRDYLEAAAILTVDIHSTKKPLDDILVILAGEEEIGSVCVSILKLMSKIRKKENIPELDVLRVYSEMKYDDEKKKTRERKVIVTTDENSFKLGRFGHVIDCGFEKQCLHNPKLKTVSMVVTPISRAKANQRASQAKGKCYRLYTETAFLEEMGPTTAPEILRTDLGEAVLRAKALGINDLSSFDLVDFPTLDSVVNGTRQLYFMGALDKGGNLTRLGRNMAEFPVGPVLSRILIASAGVDFRCSYEALTIIAMVVTGNPIFYRPPEENRVVQVGLKWFGFFHPESDHLTLLKIFEDWKNSGFSIKWCLDNFVDHEPMEKAREFRNHLLEIMIRLKLEIVSANKNYTNIRKAITAGMFFHVARRDPQEGCYRTVIDNRAVHIHSNSALFYDQPSWVVYDDLAVTDEEYMIRVTEIDPNWLHELAPQYFRLAGYDESARELGS